jgi:ferritin
VKLKTIEIEEITFSKPLEAFEKAYALELQYRDHLEKLVAIARAEGDELTAYEILKLLDKQVDSCNEFEVLVNKARGYSSLQGLFYHLDYELGKKA